MCTTLIGNDIQITIHTWQEVMANLLGLKFERKFSVMFVGNELAQVCEVKEMWVAFDYTIRHLSCYRVTWTSPMRYDHSRCRGIFSIPNFVYPQCRIS